MTKYRKTARDLGADSPAKGEARQQNYAGARGGPQEARPGFPAHQPPQESGRRSAKHQQPPLERKSFSDDPEHAPSHQGRGRPKPDTLAHLPSEQGIGAKSGSHIEGDVAEAEAMKGGPRGTHTAHTGKGRQKTPGDRRRS
ncbi:MAG TPA: hypothetical protein VFQ38_10170 [Longimicrobiales bacterium]|nr:hypothetical protein [Longimicrobiales bacterium]